MEQLENKTKLNGIVLCKKLIGFWYYLLTVKLENIHSGVMVTFFVEQCINIYANIVIATFI